MAGSVLGEKVLRKEDPKFLTTGGVYMDDFHDARLDGAAWVVYARSGVAHGTINSIDISDAVGMPGVIAVHTAETLGLEPVPSPFNPGVARTLLASGKVRWVGEPIAAIVAETYEQAFDAAQAVFADIDALPALIDMEESLASDLLHLRGCRQQRHVRLELHGRQGQHRPRVLRGLRGRDQRDRS